MGAFDHCIALIDNHFLPDIKILRRVVIERLLRALDNIDDEARGITQKTADALQRTCCDGSMDAADVCEKAEHMGVAYYISMNRTLQSIRNLFVIALYHTLQQQELMCAEQGLVGHRVQSEREIENEKHSANPSEMFIRKDKMTWASRENLVERWRTVFGKPTSQWQKRSELEDLANTIKHAEGGSAEKLRKKRPDIFKDPSLCGMAGFGTNALQPIYSPMAGDDIFVSDDDLKDYFSAVEKYWDEVRECLKKNTQE